MNEWPLKPRPPRPNLADEDRSAWMAGEEVVLTDEHALPGETDASAAESAVNERQTVHRDFENAVFRPQTVHRDRSKRATSNRCSSSARAGEVHSKAHGPSSSSAARDSGARPVIVAGLGFASAAPAEEVIASAAVPPASAAESTFDFLWRQRSEGLYGSRPAVLAGAAAKLLRAYEGEVPAPWPLVGSASAIAREILESALARGARQKSVYSRNVRDFAAGLRQLAAAGLLETTDDLGDGCLTWHGRSIPPLGETFWRR